MYSYEVINGNKLVTELKGKRLVLLLTKDFLPWTLLCYFTRKSMWGIFRDSSKTDLPFGG